MSNLCYCVRILFVFLLSVSNHFETFGFPYDDDIFEYEYACGGILEAGDGVIESPLFPDAYPPNVECTWIIKGLPGNRIHVTSDYFSVEPQPTCSFDYVAIQDGEEGQFGHTLYCGNDQLDFLSVSNILNIYFHSDLSGYDAGFRIRYAITPSKQLNDGNCNKSVVQEGEITSPNFPNDYPANAECFYSIVSPEGYHIQLTFDKFEVEAFPCEFDKLAIYDGRKVDRAKLIGTFCGRDVPIIPESNKNVLTLHFISDRSLQYPGFRAMVRFIATSSNTSMGHSPLSSVPSQPVASMPTTSRAPSISITDATRQPVMGAKMLDCNKTITSMHSNISSPNHPGEYPHDTYCVIKLRSDINSSFIIQFLNFSIEESEGCTYDSLSIYSGDVNANETDAPIRVMCGSSYLLDDLIVSWEGLGLDLVFQSDRSVSDLGFLASVLIAPLVQGPRCPADCENGGTCVETLLADGSVDWTCVCVEGFTGDFCETKLQTTCDDLVCQNGGICKELKGILSCVCPNGFIGDNCEFPEALSEGGSMYFVKMTRNMSVSVGSSLILECAVSDHTAHVMWLFHDRILTNTDWSRGVEVHPGGVVVIPEVKDEHSGRYTCMAITSGDLVESSMWLTLTEPCSLHVTKAPSNMTVREGQIAMFECYIPEADVTLWRKDGDMIEPGPRKRMLVNKYLVIKDVVETDAGQYTCAARAKSGCFAQVSAYLTIEATGHGMECGRAVVKAEPEGSERISSGREALPKSAPWHVILREDKKDTTFCGGSLISPDTVLTAAHCVGQFEMIFGYPFHPRHIQIYLGTTHCAGDNGIYRQLKSYSLHENFNDTHYNNDIAVFKLDRAVDFSSDVMPICLETPEFVQELLKPGRLGLITGCGGRYAHGIAPTYLHEVQIPYVSRDVCRERASIVNTSFTAGMFCAGYSRSMRGDACAGDSGGPYVLDFSGRSILVGIVSWGVGCDRENHYGYYTSIAHYYDWIMDKIDKE